jgi:hypothetical protein
MESGIADQLDVVNIFAADFAESADKADKNWFNDFPDPRYRFDPRQK